jgi:hypothetical protein
MILSVAAPQQAQLCVPAHAFIIAPAYVLEAVIMDAEYLVQISALEFAEMPVS